MSDETKNEVPETTNVEKTKNQKRGDKDQERKKGGYSGNQSGQIHNSTFADLFG